jgi:hypothetical protein
MHDLLPGFIIVMGLVGTLSDADLAVDAQVLVTVNAKLVVVFIDGLKQQGGYPLSFGCQKSHLLDKMAAAPFLSFHNSGNRLEP